jgi:hypothetical protein
MSFYCTEFATNIITLEVVEAIGDSEVRDNGCPWAELTRISIQHTALVQTE